MSQTSRSSLLPRPLTIRARYRPEDLLLIWMLLALFFSLPLIFCVSLLGFILLYAWLPAPWRAQHKLITLGGLLVGGLLAFLSITTLFSGESLIALCALVACLKRAELHCERDRMTLVVAVFVVIALNLLFWNSLPALLHLLCLIALMLWQVQQGAQHYSIISSTTNSLKQPLTLKSGFSPALGIVLWSLPLALILFLFMPRLPGPLWDLGLAFGLPISIYQDLSPGSIGSMRGSSNNMLDTLNNQQRIILVAEFTGAVPSKSTLYWRGPVSYGYEQSAEEETWLTDTDNTTRSQRLSSAYRNIPDYQAMLQHLQPAVNYDIKVAPHSQYWLYAPDLPLKNAQESFISKDGQLLSIRPLNQEFNYSSSSYLDATLQAEQPPPVRSSTLPMTEASAIINTAAQWRELAESSLNPGADSRETIIYQQALNFLAQPPPWFNVSVPYTADKLQRWVGVLMLTLQQAGIPARMVEGFRGGDLIALTDVVVVREKHRHFWLELWQADQGWVKVEVRDIFSRSNTAQISTVSSNQQASVEASTSSNDNNSVVSNNNTSEESSLWQRLEQWLQSYSPLLTLDEEDDLNNSSTSEPGQSWLWGMVLAVLWLVLLVCSKLYQQRTPIMEKAWVRFQQAMASQGFPLEYWQCPSQLLIQLQQQQPAWSRSAIKLTNSYLQYHYSKESEIKPANFNAQVKRFTFALKNLPESRS